MKHMKLFRSVKLILAMLAIGCVTRADDPACGPAPYMDHSPSGWSGYKRWCRERGGEIAENYNVAQAEGGCHGCDSSGNAGGSNAAAPGHLGDELIAKSLSAGLSGQITGTDAMGFIGVGLLLNVLTAPRNNGQAAAEAERRRQMQLEQQRAAEEARRAAEVAKQRIFNAGKAELSSQFRGGTGELGFKESGTDLNLKDVESPVSNGLAGVATDRATDSFTEYRDWEERKRDVLAYQKRLTQKDPDNKAVESWCKLHLPLSQSPGDRYAWECKCYQCPAPVPARSVQLNPQSAQDKKTLGGMAMKEIDAQLVKQSDPGQQPFSDKSKEAVERGHVPDLSGKGKPALDGDDFSAPEADALNAGANAPPDITGDKALPQTETMPIDLQTGTIEQIRAAGGAGFDNQQPLLGSGDIKAPDAISVKAQEPPLVPAVQPANSPGLTEPVRLVSMSQPPLDGIPVGNTVVSPIPETTHQSRRIQRVQIEVPLPEIPGWNAEANGGAKALSYVNAREQQLSGKAGSEDTLLQLKRVRRNAEMLVYYDRIINATKRERIGGMQELNSLLLEAEKKKLEMFQDATSTISDVARASRQIQLILQHTEESRKGKIFLDFADDINKVTETIKLLEIEYAAMRSRKYNREYWSEVAPKLTALATEIQKQNRIVDGASSEVSNLIASKATLLASVSYGLAKLANETLDVVILEVMTDDVNITMGNQAVALAEVQKHRKKHVDVYLAELKKFEEMHRSQQIKDNQ